MPLQASMEEDEAATPRPRQSAAQTARTCTLIFNSVLFLAMCTSACAKPKDFERLIFVANEEIDTQQETSIPGIEKLSAAQRRSTTVSQWYVQVQPEANARDIEKRVGVKLGHYIPNNAYVLASDKATAAKFSSDPAVVWVGNRPATHKVSPALLAQRKQQMDGFNSTAKRRKGSGLVDNAHIRSLFVLLLPERQRSSCEKIGKGSTEDDCSSTLSFVPASARDVVKLWSSMFKGLLFEGDVKYVSETKVLVHYGEKSFADILEWLSDRPEVVWIERRPTYKPHNSAATKMLIAGDDNSVWTNLQTENLEIRQNGIDGTGQIIGIADTGIDWDNCFFWESANSFDYPERGVEPPFNFVDQARRKIISYNWIDECELCDRCPQVIEDDRFQFASSNGLLESGKDWREAFPENAADSPIAPRTYDSSGATIQYKLEAFTRNVSSQYLAQGAGAFDFPVDIQVFVVRRADMDTFNTNSLADVPSKCVNDCLVKGSVLDRIENLEASNGGYGVIISNRGKNEATAHIWIRGTVQFMTADKPCGDDGDDNEGHGTHVSGSAAGAALTPPSQTEEQEVAAKDNGMASAAKIYFTDVMQNADPNCNIPGAVCNRVNEVSVPNDLAENLFTGPYDAGARIHLDAWGCKVNEGDRPSNCNEYTTHAMEIDKFMHEKQDFLVVTAAGDTGDQERQGTVASPATCKNCLTVGATNTWSERYRQAAAYRDPMEDVCSDCSIPQACSLSDFIFGEIANESTRPGLLQQLPACCDSELQIEFDLEETLIPAQETWSLHLPNRSTLDQTIQSDIRNNFGWPLRGASIHYTFESEFSLFGPTSVAGAKPQMQVMIFPRDDFIEYFEDGHESCIGSETGRNCRPNPCVSGTAEVERCFSSLGGPFERLEGCPAVTYEDLFTEWIDPHCHEASCSNPDERGAKPGLPFYDDCPSTRAACCNDKYLTTFCMNKPCDEISDHFSGIVRHPTDSFRRAQNGYGFVVRNMGQHQIKVKGKISIHKRDYPCRLMDCCLKEGAECCSKTFTRSFAKGNACGDQCPATFRPGECVAYEQDILAKFSSHGPAVSKWNGEDPANSIGTRRFKPDVVAPGVMVVSANSDGNPRSTGPEGEFQVQCALPTRRDEDDRNGCNVLQAGSYSALTSLNAKKGTSVSAGLVAGAAAMIRQYLVEGWFPFGVKNMSNTQYAQPQAALVKAMIINSASSMTSSVDTYDYEFEPFCNPLISICPVWVQPPPTVRAAQTGGTPNYYEGYGRPQLDKVMWFSDSPWSLWVNESTLEEQGHMASFTFPVLGASPRQPLKITLAYTDPPGTPNAANLLVNDLDLIVTRSSNQTIRDVNLGKEVTREVFQTNIGNGRTTYDNANPVEQVIVTNASATDVRVVVYSRRLAKTLSPNGQRFALVVTGLLRPRFYAWRHWRVQILERVGYTGDPDAEDLMAEQGFDWMDVFKTARIRYQDLPLRLETPFKPSDGQAREMVRDADTNGDGGIQLNEWRLLIKVLRLGSQYIKEPQSYRGIADASILEQAAQFYDPGETGAGHTGRPPSGMLAALAVGLVCLLQLRYDTPTRQ